METMTIEKLKEKVINNEIEKGLYTANNEIVEIFENGFSIKTPQDNGWIRETIYEYDRIDCLWSIGETYYR